jgi:micrococcal nuclease
VFGAMLVWAPAAVAHCPPGPLTDTVTHVGDGDTIELGAIVIRFEGIAAPERDEPGGAKAAAVLRDVLLGKEVRCELTGKATYDRCVAICYLGQMNIEAQMVRQGLARDCPRYSGGRYQQAEILAAADGATIHQTYRLPRYCR